MNDLMTRSFLSYMELKKQVQKDLEAEGGTENGQLSLVDEANLSVFFQEVEAIKGHMEEITYLLVDLRNLNEETKSAHSAKVLRGLRDRMDSDMVAVLRKAKIVKARLEALDKANVANRTISVAYIEGSAVDRTRISTTNGLRSKLREIMNDFQGLRERVLADYRDSLRRRYYNETGEYPSEETVDKLLLQGGRVENMEGRPQSVVEENRERYEAVMDIQRSLNKLHQVFLDMAVLVDTQGDQIGDIEHHVANAGSYIGGGTNSLFYAKQMKKQGKKWVLWVFAVIIIILLVCFISMLAS